MLTVILCLERNQKEDLPMTKEEKLAELRSLQVKVDAIRDELGITSPGVVTFSAHRDIADDEMVIVEADGFGGATTSVVVGNYPVDFYTKFEKFFPSEEVAETVAERVAFEGVSPRQLLAIPKQQR